MTRRPRFLLPLALTLFLAALHSLACFGQSDSIGAQARALVEEFIDAGQIPGVAVSVGIEGRIAWSEGFGYADLEQRVPVWPAITRFRVGSVAKPMTAVAIAQLYEQGKLDLDAPIQRYVSGFPDKEGVITTRLLAGHLAGIRHYQGNEFLSQKTYSTVAEGLEIFKNDPLLHAPGSKFAYSSYGFNLISAVLENAASQEFLSYMEEHVFDPIGMTQTTPDHVAPIISNRARPYVLFNNLLQNGPPVDNSYKWAGGGFLSTSEDLVRFGFAHLDSDLLRPETIRLLWTSQKTTAGEKTNYGIGWRTATDSEGRHWVGHGGGSIGGTTSFIVYPEEQVVIVLVGNMSGIRWGELPNKLADLFLPVGVAGSRF